jgi:hypothetical protein
MHGARLCVGHGTGMVHGSTGGALNLVQPITGAFFYSSYMGMIWGYCLSNNDLGDGRVQNDHLRDCK